MAEAIAANRADAKRAEARLVREAKLLADMGIDLANLEALDREISGEAETELREMEARLDSQSHLAPVAGVSADIDMGLLPEGARPHADLVRRHLGPRSASGEHAGDGTRRSDAGQWRGLQELLQLGQGRRLGPGGNGCRQDPVLGGFRLLVQAQCEPLLQPEATVPLP